MKLQKLYSLRKDFTIIGLTGQVGAGCSEISNLLSQDFFNKNISQYIVEQSNNSSELKYNICANFLMNDENWRSFKTIHYKDILLLHLFHEGINKSPENDSNPVDEIIDIIYQNGKNGKFKDFQNRFDHIEDKGFKKTISRFLKEEKDWETRFSYLGCNDLIDCLRSKRDDSGFYKFYFEYFEDFSRKFYELLNEYSITKRTRLCHDLANNLRDFCTVYNLEDQNIPNNERIENIYTVAETINEIIKIWKSCNPFGYTKIVIDALKNSLELMFFKEKYSAFYMVATKKPEEERRLYVKEKIYSNYSDNYNNEELDKHCSEILKLDEVEYDGGEFNEGEFAGPDIENCIQKSDYHIFFSNSEDTSDNSKIYKDLKLEKQLVKFVALIHQPGIITPTAVERSMQIAYNAKFNSGCISRQVGALVTDENFTVKAIGWNDVPQNQIPCNLRSINDLKTNTNSNHFSDFEKGKVSDMDKYDDNKTFKEKIELEYDSVSKKDLEGKNCSFCFKTCHNAFEGKKNQVHTRSLHAEENAMLQISKYGGQALKGGNLFTTASPCELCSKKAFQLGIINIFYIDPYPGISREHIINNSIDKKLRPNYIMFQGAVGRTFHKLYEPFMAYKDELTILTGINPKTTQKQKIQSITNDRETEKLIEKILNDPVFKQKVEDINNSK